MNKVETLAEVLIAGALLAGWLNLISEQSTASWSTGKVSVFADPIDIIK